MKLLVFAYTPPPFHGQSFMIKQMLDGFALPPDGSSDAGQEQIICYHVNAHFASDMDDMGRFRWKKVWLIFRYCVQAVFLRFRHGVENLYYCPSHSVKNSLVRDWAILLLCRPFFKRLILNWQAAGLGEWLEKTQPPVSQWLSHLLLDKADLAIAVSRANVADAERFFPKKLALIYNGAPDPCPEFMTTVLEFRRSRLKERLLKEAAGVEINVLFLALCCKEKGLLDAVEAIKNANDLAAATGACHIFKLTVAGKFLNAHEESLFRQAVLRCGLENFVRHVGFLGGAAKSEAFAKADIFCFPTYYWAESAPLVVLEAMAWGLPVLTTRWRSLPEFFPEHYFGLVEPQNPGQIAAGLLRLSTADLFDTLRQRYLELFTTQKYLEHLRSALLAVQAS